MTDSATITAGGALLARLKAVGVDWIFANSGTDFPPIIEGLAEAAASNIALPNAVVIPHEHAAMGMAHGYFLLSGRPQAVMAHTNVGLANCAIGAINAATEHVPVLLFSGRTPTVEQGRFGARTVPIGWGQEMRDQAAMVREASKWDYELRFPEQVPDVVDRAHAIAASTPKGPVYVSLPREVLCEPCPVSALHAPPRMRPVPIAPTLDAVAAAAALLAGAERPLIVAQRGAGSAEAFAILSQLATDWAIPVCQYWAVQLAIPTDHPCMSGSTRRRSWPRRTSSWSSTRWRPGRPPSTRRLSDARSSRPARTRCSPASRSAISAPTSRSPAKPPMSWQRSRRRCSPISPPAPECGPPVAPAWRTRRDSGAPRPSRAHEPGRPGRR